MNQRVSRARQWLGAGLAATVATAGAMAFVPQAQADPDDVSRSSNVKQVANQAKRSPLDSNFNSDIAFWGDYAFQGNYDGFTIWDISKPKDPQIVSQILCPGGQGDVTVTNDGDLLFMSVNYARTDDTCSSEAASTGSPTAWEGIRIFDISNLRNPDYVGAVRTDCGSHTNTLVPDEAGEAAYIYVSSYGPSSLYPNCQPPHDSISIIEVPLDEPGAASVVAKPNLFPDGGGLRTSGCHDITAYPDRQVAAGACMGDGILMDISDPVNPQVIDRVSDENFAFWHSATFSNHGTKVVFTDELGGGGAPTCNAAIGPQRGANAIFDIAGAGSSRDLRFRSYFKIPRHQTDNENCVAHNGSLIPVKGRDVMVQAWYQGGVSVFDFTNSSAPEEIGYWDRGALSDEFLTLGGSWSAYYYNGYVYSSDIQQGLDVLKVSGQKGAKKVEYDVLNAQTQYRYSESKNGKSNKKKVTGNTAKAPVILPGSPGAKPQKVAPDNLRGLRFADQSAASEEANSADRRYMEMMIPHHYQAIAMSRLAETRNADPRLSALAERILVEQQLEIAAMQGWQARNGLPVTDEIAAYKAMLRDPAMLEQMGMATRKQFRALRDSEGAEFDAGFLNLMVPHHEGAIRMSENIGVNGDDLFVRQFSTDVLVTQGQQIGAMEDMQD